MWRTRSTDLDATIERIRAHYEVAHPVVLSIRSLATDPRNGDPEHRAATLEAARAAVMVGFGHHQEWEPQLQIFDEGETVLIRPLEGFDWFSGQVLRCRWDLTSAIADDDAETDRLMAWIDEQTATRQFRIVPLLEAKRLGEWVERAYSLGTE